MAEPTMADEHQCFNESDEQRWLECLKQLETAFNDHNLIVQLREIKVPGDFRTLCYGLHRSAHSLEFSTGIDLDKAADFISSWLKIGYVLGYLWPQQRPPS